MENGKTKNKNERMKINNDMALMWLNWSIVIINAILQLLDIYIYIYIQIQMFCYGLLHV